MNPTWLTALASLLGVLVAGYLWTTRHIVRDELEPMRNDIARQGEDIAVLRTSVFNHLSHGEIAEEQAIRERLGYGPRK